MMAAKAPMRDFALEVHFSRWEFSARYNLAGSDAQSMSVKALLDLAGPDDRQGFQDLGLGYTRTFGAPDLLEAIAGTYETVGARYVLCFAGAEEAVYVAMRTLLGEDDHAIVVTPSYQAAETVTLAQCAVTGVALDIDAGWALDVDRLKRAIRPNTRLISINFPNNPTGRIIPRADLMAIVELCRRRGIWLFSDEVYRGMERDPASRLPQVADLYERGISLGVMSKAYGLPGLRIGWLACKDRQLLVRLERYKHYLSICNSAPSEALATIALKARDAILDRNRSIVAKNLAVLEAFFAEFPHLFEWRVPDGGCVGFIRYKGSDGVEAFTKRLVEEAGVLLLPASVFRSELTAVPADCLRIGFGQENMPQAVDALRAWLQGEAGEGRPTSGDSPSR